MKNRLQILALAVFLLSACKHNHTAQKTQFTYCAISSEISSHKKTLETISPYQTNLKSITEEILVSSKAEFTRIGDQTTLGNFVCDALKNYAQKNILHQHVDIVVLNRGSLRANLPQGNVKVSNIFEVMPFDNDLVVVTLKGSKLDAFADMIPKTQPAFLGATIQLKKNKIFRFDVGKDSLVPDKIYSVLTSDFLLNGGDNFNFLKENEGVIFTGIKVRNAIIDYCREMQKLSKQLIPYTDERLQISE